MAPNRAGRIFFLLIQTLPKCWAELNWTLFFLCGPHISGFPGPQISTFPDFQVPRSPNSQISRFPDFQTRPPALAPPDPDELSDPNLTPLPTHPGIKYVARSPCCDQMRRQWDPRYCLPQKALRKYFIPRYVGGAWICI